MTAVRRLVLLAAGCLATLTILSPAVWAESEECAAPDEMIRSEFGLPHLRDLLDKRAPIKIVAIGGGSTVGAAAGSADLAYPHRLEEALRGRFPAVKFAVLNKGVARQTTQEMLDRFPRDVIAEQPTLVVWEVGINDAVRGVDVEDFAAALQTGLDQLKAHGIDAVLMDMQFSHKVVTIIDFDHYLGALHRVADVNEIYVFPRFEMMRYWSEQGMFNFDGVAKEERVRLAAKVYQCVGRRLAEAMQDAVR